MIKILDYGLGNVKAFVNAYNRLGVLSESISSLDSISTSNKIILPGVGHFDDAMKKLSSKFNIQDGAALHCNIRFRGQSMRANSQSKLKQAQLVHLCKCPICLLPLTHRASKYIQSLCFVLVSVSAHPYLFSSLQLSQISEKMVLGKWVSV